MANPEHLKILKHGVEQWNKWRKEHPEVTPDLSKADLGMAFLSEVDDLHWPDFRAADLHQVDLGKANLIGADLRRARLWGASLQGVNLSKADLSGANLRRANLGEADLRGAYLLGTNLSGTELRAANFGWADLAGADLSGARIGGTYFADLDLGTAGGLETVEHCGPSTIGIDTIYKSRGKIPKAFLRGCGLQNWEIELVKLYQPDLAAADLTTILYRVSELRSGALVLYSSCFISYSTKDREFAEQLRADLQAKGVRCWFAPEEMKAGPRLYEQTDEAIRLHDKLLLILSEHSMSSNWVKTEIANARVREEREHKQLLFPITLAPFEDVKKWKLFEADTGIDSAREIREDFIPDFSNWKDHDSYQTAFQRLVSDLKAATGR